MPRGLAPSNRVRQLILNDAGLRSMSVQSLRRAQVVAQSRVATAFSAASAAPAYEQRMAALSARIRAKQARAAEE